MKTVEAHQAFVFTCDDCGVDTFGRLVVAPNKPRTRFTNCEPRGLWLMIPIHVECSSCGQIFKTVEQ